VIIIDNDVKLVKKMKSIYKRTAFKLNYYNKNIYNEQEGNELIRRKIIDNDSLMVSRFGAVEARCVDYYLKNRKYSKSIINDINIAAGVFPNTDKMLNEFSEFYMECAKSIDVLAVWQVKNERKLVDKYCSNANLIELKGLEPYYFINPWSYELKDKRVLLIHPCEKSIIRQYGKREVIFENKEILPQFRSLETIKAIQSAAGEVPDFKDWFDAYEYMCNEIKMKNFDVAIIGAGSYGLPLASFIKKLGKKAIHMAGATQLLFGIKGKRWDNNPIILNLYNENWVRPIEEEIPRNFSKVEGGSYW
jgi:hypothetical protein